MLFKLKQGTVLKIWIFFIDAKARVKVHLYNKLQFSNGSKESVPQAIPKLMFEQLLK